MLVGRFGRPGLIRTVARTAVIAGTAGAVQNRQARRFQDQQAAAQYQHEQELLAAQQQAAQQAAQRMAAPQQASPGDDLIAQLERLGQLRTAGVISDDEFAQAKAKLLG